MEAGDDRTLINELFLRILNRPAADAEIEATLATIAEIDADHQKVQGLLNDREAFWKTEKPRLETVRSASMAKSTADLKAYEQKIAPQVAAAEKKRLEAIAKTEADLKAYESALDQHASGFLKQNVGTTEWHMLEAESLEAVKGITLRRQADRSVLAEGKASQGAYTLTFRTSLQGITGFRVEALPVPGRKGNGPGLPENGNFVVTEFEVQAAPAGKPKEMQKISLHKAKADFLQPGFNIGLAVDGKPGNQNAWAVANALGVVHWATFETKQPAGYEAGT